jgi:hypothetical protein
LVTTLTFAGVLALGAAALTNCYGGWTVGDPPPTTTTTPTTLPQGQIGVAPTDGPIGTVVNVLGSNCVSDAGHIEVFLATTEDPTTRLTQSGVVADARPPGNWSVALTVPAGVAPGSDDLVEAQCWSDGTPFGHPGQQVLYFAYTSQPFTVD